jgi:hypothetical protein
VVVQENREMIIRISSLGIEIRKVQEEGAR